MRRVRILDYKAGNIFSVIRAFSHLGCEATLVSRPEEVLSGDYLVLPGVGAFGDGIRNLRSRNLIEPMLEWIGAGKPFLGICLGMQLLMETSEELGKFDGLGVIPGSVQKLPPDMNLKVPNIGWHSLAYPEALPQMAWNGSVLDGVSTTQDMYFVHSFAAYPNDPTHWLARTQFGEHWFCSVLRRENVYGCQFHPERSARAGLSILENFLRG